MHSLPDLSWFNRVFVLKLLSVDDVFLVPQTNLGLGNVHRKRDPPVQKHPSLPLSPLLYGPFLISPRRRPERNTPDLHTQTAAPRYQIDRH